MRSVDDCQLFDFDERILLFLAAQQAPTKPIVVNSAMYVQQYVVYLLACTCARTNMQYMYVQLSTLFAIQCMVPYPQAQASALQLQLLSPGAPKPMFISSPGMPWAPGFGGLNPRGQPNPRELEPRPTEPTGQRNPREPRPTEPTGQPDPPKPTPGGPVTVLGKAGRLCGSQDNFTAEAMGALQAILNVSPLSAEKDSKEKLQKASRTKK